ncbi:MAG: hypothetical protein HY698_09050 [Deltaproteobacteria bacterium]|nr:hypothetical protein [Deltaproteobacteria bacterium]
MKERRALTQARSWGRIYTQGEPKLARQLSKALDVADVGARVMSAYTHGLHTYPARMHPITARRAIRITGLETGGSLLDPFCGSGTVLVEGVLHGARCIGVDASPLAVLLSRAKTWHASDAARAELVHRARRISALAVEEGKAARRRTRAAAPPRPLPSGVSEEARSQRLRGWFAPHVRRELETLASCIGEEEDQDVRDALLVVLSSILVKVSRRESDTSGRVIERRIARGMAARLFATRAEELARGLEALWRAAPHGTPPPRVRLGDARSLGRAGVGERAVDAIVTSPPYAGTYDYLEHHLLRLTFLGIPVSELRAWELGARRKFAGGEEKLRAALLGWERDLADVLAQMAHVLRPGGRAVVLIGDSLAGTPPNAVPVHAGELVLRLANQAGLDFVASASQARTALGSAEKQAFTARPKLEHLILLERRDK